MKYQILLIVSVLAMSSQSLIAQWKQFEGAHSYFQGKKVGENSDQVFFIINERLHVSNNKGLKFEIIELGFKEHYKVSNASMFENTIVANIEKMPFDSTQNLIISQDNGKNWETLLEKEKFNSAIALSKDKIFRSRYLGGTIGTELLESNDNGKSWQLNRIFSEIRDIQYYNGSFYLTEFNIIYRLKDGETEWKEYYRRASAIKWHLIVNKWHFVQGYSGNLEISIDEGINWQKGSSDNINQIIFYKDKLYGIKEHKIYSSIDNGLTWISDNILGSYLPSDLFTIFSDFFASLNENGMLVRVNTDGKFDSCVYPNLRFNAIKMFDDPERFIYLHSFGISSLDKSINVWRTTYDEAFYMDDAIIDNDSIIIVARDNISQIVNKKDFTITGRDFNDFPSGYYQELHRSGNILYFLSRDSIYTSMNNGIDWEYFPIINNNVILSVQSMSIDGSYFYLISGNELYYSNDLGITFKKAAFSLPVPLKDIWYSHLFYDGSSVYWSLRIHPAMGKDHRVFRINPIDIESEWEGIENTGTFFYGNVIRDLLTMSRFSFASIAWTGLFMSEDGMSWKPLNPNPPFRFPTDLLIKDGKLFVATEDEGIWTIGLDELGITVVKEPKIRRSDLKIFPNPSRESIHFIKNLEPYMVDKVRITDLSGRLIYSSNHVNSTLMDIEFLQSGIYLLKVNDESVLKLVIQK